MSVRVGRHFAGKEQARAAWKLIAEELQRLAQEMLSNVRLISSNLLRAVHTALLGIDKVGQAPVLHRSSITCS